jgi:uroporphyrinogen-III synthase
MHAFYEGKRRFRTMRPRLDNKTLAITRDLSRNSEFIRLVKNYGGKPVSLPTIKLTPKDPKSIFQLVEMIQEKDYEYYVFMSLNAVEILFSLAEKINLRENILDELRKKKIISLGPSVRKSLEKNGIDTDLMPQNYSSHGLLSYLKSLDLGKETKILIPRSSASSSFMKDALSALGLKVDEFFLYTPETNGISDVWIDFSDLLEKGKVHSLIFTSPSSVKSFCQIMQDLLPKFRDYCAGIRALISIGPLTSEELLSKQLVSIEAKEHTVKGAFELALKIVTQNR